MREPCTVTLLPTNRPLQKSDTETIIAARGVDVLECDLKREGAVQGHDTGVRKRQEWADARAKRRCPWYRFGTCRAEE